MTNPVYDDINFYLKDGVLSVPSEIANIFKGTQAEYDAKTEAEKQAYDFAAITG